MNAIGAQTAYQDFKKVVDKYFSKEAFSEKIFNSADMALAIEEITTAAEKFSRHIKQQEKQNENKRID